MRLGLFRLTPGVRNIIIVTTAFFLLDRIVMWTTGTREVALWLGLIANPLGDPVATGLQVWRPFTYMLVHGDVWHLFWNMVGLWFMGAGLEEHLGEQRLYRIYVLSGLGGALAAILAGFFLPVPLVIGASGAVLGVVFAFIRIFPDSVIYLWLTIPVKALYLGILYAIMTILTALGGGQAGVSTSAHLGGMVAGWLVAGQRAWLDELIRFNPAEGLKRRWRRRHLRPVPARRGSGSPVSTIPDPPFRPVAPVDPGLEEQVDRILDKVRVEGMDALTPEERKVLDLHSTRLRQRDHAR